MIKTWQIGASNNDGHGYDHPCPLEAFSFTDIRVFLGYQYHSGLRFTDVDIPKGSIIRSAHLKVCAHLYPIEGGDIDDQRIYGNNEDNCAAFSDGADWCNRLRTTAYVTWVPEPQFPNIWYDSPDISSIIQEIVNRAGWKSGNALAIILEHHGATGNERRFWSWDGSPTKAPKLEVTWTPPLGKAGSRRVGL